jgi:hypothetical protein
MSLYTIVLVVTYLCAPCGALSPGQAAHERPDAFTVLHHKTGWVLIGVLSLKSYEPYNIGSVHPFEFVRRRTETGRSELPVAGDVIRPRVDLEVVILDFATTGESNRLVPPTTRQKGSPADLTGLYVLAGTAIVVEDARVSAPVGGQGRLLWLRISPYRD